MTSTRWLRLGNIVAFLATIAVNSLANILPLNGITTGELSDYYGNLFTPAGYVFSIWGVIYLLLAVFAYYQFKADESLHEKIDILFIISCLFNSVWIFLWHFQYIFLSLFAMFGILWTLIQIYVRLGIGVSDVSNDERNMAHLPFSVYLGWITVAPIANVAAYLVGTGWNGFNQAAINMTVGMIAIAMALTLINTYTRSDVAYAAVIVWALGGILQKQMGTPLIPQTAAVAMLIIVIGVAVKKSGRLG
jgi:benzodiazapine receptor